MKKLLFLLFLLPTLAFSQSEACVKVDSVYSTAKLRELGNRDIRFGIKQIAEDMLSNKYSAMGSFAISNLATSNSLF